MSAQIKQAILAPGKVSVYAVDMVVPAAVRTGVAEVILSAGGRSSQIGATVVRPVVCGRRAGGTFIRRRPPILLLRKDKTMTNFRFIPAIFLLLSIDRISLARPISEQRELEFG